MRSFAVVPAAGHSQRMGRPKLLLAWRGAAVIEHVLNAWRASRVERAVVVVRPGDEQLAATCRRCGAEVVVPAASPAEMKVSIQLGLQHIAAGYQPSADDAWLLAPADMPRLSPVVIDRLTDEHRPDQPAILVPIRGGRRGHPVLFPWPLAAEVARLADDEGVNALLSRHPVREVPCEDPAILEDLDTPSDYERLRLIN